MIAYPLAFVEAIQQNIRIAISTLGNDDNSGESVRHFKSLMNDDFFCVENKLRIDLNCTINYSINKLLLNIFLLDF